jgi:hypothetical protein
LGSPIANLVIRDLVAYNRSTSFTVAAATSTATRGRFFLFATSGFGRFDQSADDGAAFLRGAFASAEGSSVVRGDYYDAAGNGGAGTLSLNLAETGSAHTQYQSIDSALSDDDSAERSGSDTTTASDHLHAHDDSFSAAVDAALAAFENVKFQAA